ncbi:MAG: hypothetical protein ACP5GJ_00205 [Nanopusillaceae archaeon]|jgi:hypothetical protein
MNLYEKYTKREIRLSKKFKKNSEINIIALESNTKDFALNIIKNIDKKFNMNFKINLKTYKKIEEIELTKDSILILPIEGIFLSFLIYNYNKDEKYKYFIKKKNEFFYNIGYNISEYYISKNINKEPFFFTEYKDLLKFIYDIISLKEKYVFGLKNILDYFSKYYL